MANKQRGSTSELERDSGLSDASSGYHSAIAQIEYEKTGFDTQEAKNMQSGPQVRPVPGSYPGVSPMFIMNNVVLQQRNSVTPSLKPWGFNSSLEMVPQSSLVFFHPVVPSGSCTYQSRPTHQRQSKNDIMNSFSSIAPHPAHRGKGDHKHSLSHSHGGRRQQRRQNNKHPLCVSSNQKPAFETSTAGNRPVDLQIFRHDTRNVNSEKHSNHQEPTASTMPFSLCSDSFPASFPECSEATFSPSDEAENFSEALSPNTSKRKRFCNTYNILNQSGLLGITLRTKELIRQNKHSQAQLQKLQAHTDLFLEAVSSRDPQVWTKLQLTLQNNTDESKEDMLGNAICCM